MTRPLAFGLAAAFLFFADLVARRRQANKYGICSQTPNRTDKNNRPVLALTVDGGVEPGSDDSPSSPAVVVPPAGAGGGAVEARHAPDGTSPSYRLLQLHGFVE